MDTMEELTQEVQNLRTRCRYLEQENHRKDNEIAGLDQAHKKLQEMKRSASIHSFHPTMALVGLPEEFEAVKKGLKETVEKCQRLLSHLDLVTQAKSPEVTSRDFQTQTSFSEDLEGHTTGLRETVNELNRKLDQWRESHIFHTQAVQHETFQDAVAQYHEAQLQIEQLQDENLRLKHQNGDLRQLVEKMTTVQATSDAEAKECIQVLKEQSLAYREDFDIERRDRETAQSRVAELEAQVTSMQRVIQDYENQQMGDIIRRRSEALERYRVQARGSIYQTDSQSERGMGEDTTDCVSVEMQPLAPKSI